MTQKQYLMTDEDLEAARAEIGDLREDLRDTLAENPGGSPNDDDDATQHPVVDGGE